MLVYSDSVLCLRMLNGSKDGEKKVSTLRKNCWESLEKQLNSSRFFRKSRMICERETLNLKKSQTGTSSCQCSTTSIGQRKDMMEFVFRIRKSQGLREEILAGTLTARFWVLETKRSGMELFFIHLMGLHSQSDGGAIRKHRSSSILRVSSALSRGILKKRMAETPRTSRCEHRALIPKSFISVNQLSIFRGRRFFGQIIPLCRESTFSRAHPQSRIFAAIPAGN